MLWVVKITQDIGLSLMMFETIRHINLLAPGSMPADGSSSKITSGLPKIAMAVYNLRLLPPLRFSAYLLIYS